MNNNTADDIKHDEESVISPQRADETSALGSMPNSPLDIDAAEKAFNGTNDEEGPRELGS